MAVALEVTGLSKRLGDFELKDITFSVPQGSIFGIIGQSGAGKSTLLNTIMGVYSADVGEVRILGDGDNRKKVGVLFERYKWHESFTSKDVRRVQRRLYPDWDTSLFENYLELLKVPPKEKVMNMPRGVRLKLSLASILSHHPQLILLDGTTRGQEPVVQNQIWNLIRELVITKERAVVLFSDINSNLEQISDNTLFLYKGSVGFNATKEQIKDLGVLKCTFKEFGKIAAEANCLGKIKNDIGYEILISNIEEYVLRNPMTRVETPNMRKILSFFINGVRENESDTVERFADFAK